MLKADAIEPAASRWRALWRGGARALATLRDVALPPVCASCRDPLGAGRILAQGREQGAGIGVFPLFGPDTAWHAGLSHVGFTHVTAPLLLNRQGRVYSPVAITVHRRSEQRELFGRLWRRRGLPVGVRAEASRRHLGVQPVPG